MQWGGELYRGQKGAVMGSYIGGIIVQGGDQVESQLVSLYLLLVYIFAELEN